MIKTKISIERQINERQYQFIVPQESPLIEIDMILKDILKFIQEKIAESEVKDPEKEE